MSSLHTDRQTDASASQQMSTVGPRSPQTVAPILRVTHISRAVKYQLSKTPFPSLAAIIMTSGQDEWAGLSSLPVYRSPATGAVSHQASVKSEAGGRLVGLPARGCP